MAKVLSDLENHIRDNPMPASLEDFFIDYGSGEKSRKYTEELVDIYRVVGEYVMGKINNDLDRGFR